MLQFIAILCLSYPSKPLKGHVAEQWLHRKSRKFICSTCKIFTLFLKFFFFVWQFRTSMFRRTTSLEISNILHTKNASHVENQSASRQYTCLWWLGVSTVPFSAFLFWPVSFCLLIHIFTHEIGNGAFRVYCLLTVYHLWRVTQF